ncbi:hypothetical protein [Lichenicoccus sp.]|uniref:hypothetical protein n=1 Tax=Lichenicoccus sp. TaxID=2781899 RepID=UPI003D0A8D96
MADYDVVVRGGTVVLVQSGGAEWRRHIGQLRLYGGIDGESFASAPFRGAT